MKRNGASDDDAAKIMEAQRRSKYLGLRPPREFIRIRDGDLVAMGKREWRVITAGGHSPEHALFYCESDKILIAGDQVLSHMTPSVITPSAQPEANPMKEYLDSLTRLETLPPDTLVLPSHGLPFRGLHDRLANCASIIRPGSMTSRPSSQAKPARLRSRRKCFHGCCTPIRARRSASRWRI
jgi:glyoxylase-like metal-dependent hydrolase (beta-lactamase superfamily II)